MTNSIFSKKKIPCPNCGSPDAEEDFFIQKWEEDHINGFLGIGCKSCNKISRKIDTKIITLYPVGRDE